MKSLRYKAVFYSVIMMGLILFMLLITSCASTSTVTGKHYHHVGGVFVFDSKESLTAFRDSELAKSTGVAYKFVEPPATRVLEIAKVLKS